MSERYTKEELKQIVKALELSKEMMQLCYTDDGKFKHTMPAIGMAWGIGIGMVIGMSMHIQMAYIAEKEKQSLSQSELSESDDREE